MAELPFGDNPFGEEATTDNAPPSQVQPTPSTVLAQPVPTQKDKEKNAKKRGGGVIDLEGGRCEATKKGKHTADGPSTGIAGLFGEIATKTFSEETVKVWCSRDRTEANFCFKQGLGEVFLHGLNHVNYLEGEVAKLEKSYSNAKSSASYYKGQLNDSEKKLFDLGESHKANLKKLQDSLDEARENAQTQEDAHAKVVEKLQTEINELKANKRNYQRESYSDGFLAYLCNFLAGDPDYDWVKNFAPFTPAFIAKFKVDNASAIEKAKTSLQQKVAKELELAAAEENRRKEAAAQGNQEGERGDGASPSNTIVT